MSGDASTGSDVGGSEHLAARLEEQTRYFWTIDTVSDAIDSTPTTEGLLELALGRVIEATGATAGAAYSVQQDGRWLMLAQNHVPDRIMTARGDVGPDNRGLSLILEAGGPVTYSERADEPSVYVSEEGKREGVQSWAGTIIANRGTVYGVLTIVSPHLYAFDDGHLDLLKVIGQLLGLALASSLGHERALLLANTQLRDRLAELETVLSSMSDGLLLCDGEGVIVRANRSASRLLGIPVGQIVGQTVLAPEWNKVVDQDDGDAGPLSRLIRTGEECHNCSIQMTVKGETRIFAVSAAPIQKADGTSEGGVVVIRDITEERQASEMREEFLGLLSHELRAPITVISGYAQMLSRKLADKGMLEQSKQADLIKEHSSRMTGLITDLVESERLVSGLPVDEKEPTDIGELVQSVTGRMRAEQRLGPNKHDIKLEIEPGLPLVQTNKRRIDQVLTNLLSNAVRYSPGGGDIHVQVELLGPEGSEQPAGADGNVRVSVTDQGIGVPPDEKEHLFERAFRGKQAQSISAQGLGLGLYLCKLVVQAHHGQIGAEDGPGGVGTCFWFTLPV